MTNDLAREAESVQLVRWRQVEANAKLTVMACRSFPYLCALCEGRKETSESRRSLSTGMHVRGTRRRHHIVMCFRNIRVHHRAQTRRKRARPHFMAARRERVWRREHKETDRAAHDVTTTDLAAERKVSRRDTDETAAYDETRRVSRRENASVWLSYISARSRSLQLRCSRTELVNSHGEEITRLGVRKKR